jgi:uncharacterized membrane protein
MAELIVVGFQNDIHRASEVLKKLLELNDDSVVDLRDAEAVYRDKKGKLRVDQSYQMTAGEGAARGALLGLMIGSTLALPFTKGVSAAVAETALAIGALSGTGIGTAMGAADAGTQKEESGISSEFVQRVGAMIKPGDSAIYALLRVGDPEAVAAKFRGYGGTILRTSLSKEQQAGVEQLLAAGRP